MKKWLAELDGLLRGKKTDLGSLRAGTEQLRTGLLAPIAIGLGVVYGLFMGLYAVLSRTPPVYRQLLASALKVPALFFFTLFVTFPSLYVFSALLGVRLGPVDAFRIIVAAMTVGLTVLASFGPITGFFTLTTTSYPFMKLLSIFFFGVSGCIGLGFLLSVLRRVEEAEREPSPGTKEQGGAPDSADARAAAGPPGKPSGRSGARWILKVWLFVYALVGVQMAWILRPFIGDPELKFVWFMQRGGNAFVHFYETVLKLFSK